MKYYLSSTFATLMLVGCGGGGSTGTVPSTINTGTGYYVDSAVEGVDYVCGSQAGKTETDGKFIFEKGKECKFTLAGIPLRTIRVEDLVDGKKNYENNLTVARFLQSIDSDGNPDNGTIEITDKVITALKTTLTETQRKTVPEGALLDTVVANVEDETGVPRDVRTDEEVKAHLTKTQTEVTKELLAGKTFYVVEKDGNDKVAIFKIFVNREATSIKKYKLDGTFIQDSNISIVRNKMISRNDTDGSYTLVSQEDGYIFTDVYNSDGSKDNIGYRLYTSQSDAQAYYASLTIKLNGTITYDSVPVNANGVGLDYAHTTKKSVRGAVVRVLNALNQELGRTVTDKNGYYEFTLTDIKNKDKVKVQVLAKLKASNWDFQVKDNTNGDSLYVMEGNLVSLGTNPTQTRNLNASSGWGGSSYISTRTAAPFAILDVVYQAIQKVRSADSSIMFPPLNIFWSKNNKSASGNISNGDIVTSYYNGDSSFYILGDENSDTDEYDSGVIAHEWGHYYEAKFSRADSIGGGHGGGDFLDIRLAFGEGFGNSISSMIRDNPNYWDTLGRQQTNGWSMNLETETNRDNPGWFSEASIQRILYDIYDSHNDIGDTISYGFKPIHQLLIGKEKNTPAFTSIFTFIKGLKDEHPSDATAIDNIVAQESIASITDIYGSGRTNRKNENANPLYADLRLGSDVTIKTNYSAISSSANYKIIDSQSTRENELGIYNFVKVTIPSDGDYTITVTQIGNSGNPDPDFYLYKGASHDAIASVENPPALSERLTKHLNSGIYRMAIIVYNQYSGTSYNVKLVKN